MSSALAERPTLGPAVVTAEQLELVKKTVANGATPAELQLYIYDCARQGVHPLDRLLHFTKRGGKYTPVTSIDLMRIRASETGEYAGSDDATFHYINGEGEDSREAEETYPQMARVTVWRLTQGQRFAYTSTARWSEYFPGEQSGHMWKKMPHTMLAKCAEALALRKGFPRQLAGLYAKEELDQADRPTSGASAAPAVTEAENGAIVDVDSGAELPEPPKGYHYVSGYKFANGWHEFRLLNFDAQGGSIKLSTKKNIGSVAEQAQADRIPVKVTTVSKRNAIGEAYLDSIEKLPATWKPHAVEQLPADAQIVPLTDQDISF